MSHNNIEIMKLLKKIMSFLLSYKRIDSQVTPTVPESATFNELMAIWNEVQNKTPEQEVDLAEKLVHAIETLEDLERFPSGFDCDRLRSPKEFAEKEVGLADNLEALLALGDTKRTYWTKELAREKIAVNYGHTIITMDQFEPIFESCLMCDAEFELGIKCIRSLKDYLTLSKLFENGCSWSRTFDKLLTEAFRFKGQKIAQCEIESVDDLTQLQKLHSDAPAEFQMMVKVRWLKVVEIEIFKCKKLADFETLLLHCPPASSEADLIIDEILRLSESNDSDNSENPKSAWTLEQLHSLFEQTGMTRLRSLVIRRRAELLHS